MNRNGWIEGLLLPPTRLFCALALLLTASCTASDRAPAVPSAMTAEAQIAGMPKVRYWADGDPADFIAAGIESVRLEVAWRESQGLGAELPPANFLAISGGGEDGAFAAGLLVGWTESGQRPDFKAVTGVSTGALIAPFAFLGPEYDTELQRAYTTISKDDIYEDRSFLVGIFSDALSDTTPMHQMVERIVTPDFLQRIAEERNKGRLLFVATTNLDARRAVIWNMTEIAASGQPNALELFRSILLASAAVPAAFPPVMIDVVANGQSYQEMHVDGGAVQQVFLYPPTVHLEEISQDANFKRERHLYLIRNGRLDAEWSEVKRETLTIAGRAISSLIQSQGAGDLDRIYMLTERDGIDYNLAYIPSTFDVPLEVPFDTNYMNALFALGHDLAAKGYDWQKTPPGFAPAASP